MCVLLDTTFALRAPRSGTGVCLERLQEALAGREDVTVLVVANRRRRAPGGGGSWEAVTDQYERPLTSVYEASRPGPLPQTAVEPDLAPVA